MYIAGFLEKVDISSSVYSWQQQPARAKHRNMQEKSLLLLVLLPALLLNSMLHHYLERCMRWHSAAFSLKVFSGTTSRYTDTEALLVTSLEKGIPLKGMSLKRGLS